MFVGTWNKNHKAVLNNLKRNLSTFRDDLKNHPNVYRIDNRPVMLIYTPTAYQPEQWKSIMEKLEKEYPNLHLGFFLYSNHADFPVRYKPNPKIVLVIADITYSRVHSTLDPRSKTRVYYKSILDKWKNAPNIKFFRGYNWNLAESVMPYSKLLIWADDLPYYKSINVQGIYLESNKGASNLGPANYAEAQLLWNTKLKWQDILAKYCRSAYGKGAGPMIEYYTMQALRQRDAGIETGSFHAIPLIYDREFVKKSRELINRARQLADTERDQKRIDIAELSINALDDFLSFKAAYNNFEFAKAKKYFDKVRDDLYNATKNGKGYISTGGRGYLKTLHQDSVEAAVKYSTAPYKIIYKIPNKLTTMFDQFNTGNQMGYYNKAINDRKYIQTETFKSTWDEQGLLGYRAGSVWYRIRVPKLDTKCAGLLVGGVDNIVRVWCNEKYIGMGRGFAVGGGVAAAVVEAVSHIDPTREIKIEYGDGLRECRKMLAMAKAGKRNGYLLEGMACPGGCVAGAGTLLPVELAAKVVGRYQLEANATSPMESSYRDRGESLD